MARYHVLDSWRGIAAVTVTFVHVPVIHGFLDVPWFSHLRLMVDFFFVLSGFVICHAWGDRLAAGQDVGTFVLRRFGRVWPLHAAVLAGFVALEAAKALVLGNSDLTSAGAAFSADRSPEAILTNLLMIQSFGLHGMTTWNGPGWSISTEFYTYLLFALVAATLGTRVVVLVAVAALGAGGIALLAPEWIYATHDYGMFRCIFGFFTGAAAYRLHRAGHVRVHGTAVEVAALALVVAVIAIASEGPLGLLAPPVFALAVMVFAQAGGAISRALQTPVPVALGRWSYSIYMVHMLIFVAARMGLDFIVKVTGTEYLGYRVDTIYWNFGSPLANGLAIALAVVATIAVAALTFRFIEEPARRLAYALSDRRTARQPLPGAAE